MTTVNVHFKEGKKKDEYKKILKLLGKHDIKTEFLTMDHVFVLHDPDEKFLKKLEKHADLDFVSEDVGTPVLLGTPDATEIDFNAGIGMLGVASYAWNSSGFLNGFRGQNMKVGVVDSGMALSHPDLTGAVANSISFITSEPADTTNSSEYHGSVVGGIIGARGGNRTIPRDAYGTAVGVAHECQLYNAKVVPNTGSSSWDFVAQGIDWCVSQGVHVINISLGGLGAFSSTTTTAIETAVKAGISVVIAAGNKGSSDPSQENVTFPGTMALTNTGVICVANITSSKTRFVQPETGSSSTGSAVTVSAFGTGVHMLDTMLGTVYGYDYHTGTSMASPHVAGLVALLRQAKPYLTPAQIKTMLIENAEHLGAGTGWNREYGYGMARATADMFDTADGHKPSIPTIVSPLIFDEIKDTTPTITWTYSDPQGLPQYGFEVNWSHSSFSGLKNSGFIAGSANSYTLPNPLPNGNLNFGVITYNRTMLKSGEASMYYISINQTSPSVPVAPTISFSGQSNVPKLSWVHFDADGDPQTGYEVGYKLSSSGTWTYSGYLRGSVNNYTFSTLPNGTYDFCVRTWGWGYDSSPWAFVNNTVIAISAPSVAITNLSNNAKFINTMPTVAWSYSDPNGKPQTGYEVSYKDAGSGTWTSAGFVETATASTHTLSDLPLGAYDIKVNTYNQGMDVGTPATVSNVTYTNGGQIISSSNTIGLGTSLSGEKEYMYSGDKLPYGVNIRGISDYWY